jgi:hypothetical protein
MPDLASGTRDARAGDMATRRIGELYRDGDRACQLGDRITLVRLARELVERIGEPLHRELASLVDLCADPERATAAWTELKTKMQRAAVIR